MNAGPAFSRVWRTRLSHLLLNATLKLSANGANAVAGKNKNAKCTALISKVMPSQIDQTIDDRNWRASCAFVTMSSIAGLWNCESARTGLASAILPKARAMMPGITWNLVTDRLTAQAARLMGGNRGPLYEYI
uniref:Uncharacterized protein n=1 Tax=Arundo donax TaxID=35708 RepID=A0A0A9E0J4_ARUDO